MPARSAIKVKLTGELELDIERVRAIRAARPDVWLGVDANQGFARAASIRWSRRWPQPRRRFSSSRCRAAAKPISTASARPIPIAADESALGLDDVPGLVGRFDVINIKLDKCGGLTEALMIADEARRHGLGVMVGNMVGTSLAMAPAFIVGQQCDVVDLDGPTFLREDRSPACEYRDGTIWCADEVWGSRAGACTHDRGRRLPTGSASRAGSPSCSSPTCGSNSPITECARCWSIT